MVENLLLIAKDLLYSLSIIEFSEEEKDHIISVTKKVIELSLTELMELHTESK
ncbi:MAG: hypothetical protein WCY46_05010 [Tissierellaceae bacterium]